MSSFRRFAGCVAGLLIVFPLLRAQTHVLALDKIADPAVWRIVNRSAKSIDDGGRRTVQLDAKAREGLAWSIGSDFAEGTIEVDLRGRNQPGQSFVGIAFRGLDDTHYDAIYFRPFNFRSPEPDRRAHSVQYISMPGHDWPKLRADSPGIYEAGVSPIPEPDDWFHARIVVEGGKISVFVNDATSPSLVVTALGDRRGGLVGLWVGNGSGGAFANLKITARR